MPCKDKMKNKKLKVNPWLTHMQKVRKDNPKIKDFKKLAAIGKKTYKVIKK